MKLELFYPVKPLRINQGFGSNPEYYARFKDSIGNPIKGHMGIDFMAYHGQPVYAPCDGNAVYMFDSHGGDGFYIYTEGYLIILWHLCSKDDPKFKPPLPCDGTLTSVKAGQLIGYADNSGAPFESSGDHLHLGLYRLNSFGVILDLNNGFGGAIDAMPFFNNYFAENAVEVLENLKAQVSILQRVKSLVSDWLTSLLTRR